MRLPSKFPIGCVCIVAVLLSGCDRLARFDPSRIDSIDARVASQDATIKAMQAELTTLQTKLMVAEYRMDTFEQQTAATTQAAKAPSQPAALTQEQVASLNAVIAGCVKNVRASAPHTGGPLDEIDAKYWTGFDAYLNPASGRVENNVLYNGQRPALYAFNKCMAAKGVPLS